MADIWAGQVSKRVLFSIFYVFADWIFNYFFEPLFVLIL